MRKYIRSQCVAAVASIRNDGVKAFINKIIYLHRAVYIIVKDLGEVDDHTDLLRRLNLVIMEINTSTFQDIKSRFYLKARAVRASYYLDRGYDGYALIKDQRVIGDTWYVDPYKSNISSHIDLKWLGIQLPEGSVYNFDIFVMPSARGKNASSLFQGNVLYALRMKNYTKVYGYVFADNIPGMWNAVAVNGFKKARLLEVRRLVWHKGVVSKSQG
ncbi:MAG: hypothetical protein P4L43_06575 [Syntrophobacteraceae bacterium]|nr:hypothetical protein [Syntrophobacteraceae bacterium]